MNRKSIVFSMIGEFLAAWNGIKAGRDNIKNHNSVNYFYDNS